MNDITKRCLAHRYLYYVLGTPVLSDQNYDHLEAAALQNVPEDHPLRKPGSDREEDYSKTVKVLARRLLKEHRG